MFLPASSRHALLCGVDKYEVNSSATQYINATICVIIMADEIANVPTERLIQKLSGFLL